MQFTVLNESQDTFEKTYNSFEEALQEINKAWQEQDEDIFEFNYKEGKLNSVVYICTVEDLDIEKFNSNFITFIKSKAEEDYDEGTIFLENDLQDILFSALDSAEEWLDINFLDGCDCEPEVCFCSDNTFNKFKKVYFETKDLEKAAKAILDDISVYPSSRATYFKKYDALTQTFIEEDNEASAS